ncbi:MAG: rod shape-determining protein MreD [Spirochaetota bacterium]
MKKYILFIVLIGFFIFLQSTIFYESVSLQGVQPDFVLIVVCVAAYILGPLPGQVIGFCAGLLIDILAGGLLGISAFAYTVIGYGVGSVASRLYRHSVFTSAIMLFFATLIKGLLLSTAGAVFLEPGYFGFFTHGRVFLEAILNCFLAPPLFFVITRLEERFAG